MTTTLPPPADYLRLHDFRFAIRGFLSFSEQAARAVRLDPQQHQLLLAIKARGGPNGLTVHEAAERLLVRHHSVVELVDRARSNGLVSRERDGADRRVVRLRLTEHGESVLSELSAHHLEELRKAGPVLVETLRDILGTLETPAAAR